MFLTLIGFLDQFYFVLVIFYLIQQSEKFFIGVFEK